MAYLADFPLDTLKIDTLKIDRSFIQQIGSHGEAEAIVAAVMSAVMGLARSLGLHITSEGIET